MRAACRRTRHGDARALRDEVAERDRARFQVRRVERVAGARGSETAPSPAAVSRRREPERRAAGTPYARLVLPRRPVPNHRGSRADVFSVNRTRFFARRRSGGTSVPERCVVKAVRFEGTPRGRCRFIRACPAGLFFNCSLGRVRFQDQSRRLSRPRESCRGRRARASEAPPLRADLAVPQPRFRRNA